MTAELILDSSYSAQDRPLGCTLSKEEPQRLASTGEQSAAQLVRDSAASDVAVEAAEVGAVDHSRLV